ncbi:MAG TPA: DUF1080 domain-containing protein [Bryobacteraceae bacterium]|jgi:hypothetical protein|nr:DUF1080 domain-containing protein [Bryobacteraceae bacterium]
MFRILTFLLSTSLFCTAYAQPGFKQLFNGKNFDGWKLTEEHQDAFKVVDGAIVAHGSRAHLFYDGPVGNHDFKDFELRMQVKAEPNSNGGIFIHTQYQPTGWPDKGFEIQVNNTYAKDPKKGGGIYSVKDNMEPPAKDGEWYEQTIIVQGHKVTTKINGKTIVEWEQPSDWQGLKDKPGVRLSSGTIALQAHDPNSTVYYKNIRIKPLKSAS